MGTQRKAPDGGYSYPAKASFRGWVWDRIAEHSMVTLGHVLLMPSIEALEITEQAIPRGFALSRLHVVDRNPAIVATVKRRFPEVNTYGVSVERAVGKIDVSLIAANLDFCGNTSMPLLQSVRVVANSPVTQSAFLFITVLRGREEQTLFSILKSDMSEHQRQLALNEIKRSKNVWYSDEEIEPTELDGCRILAIRGASGRRFKQARAYVSTNGQSFLTVWLDRLDPPIKSVEVNYRTTSRQFGSVSLDESYPDEALGAIRADYREPLFRNGAGKHSG